MQQLNCHGESVVPFHLLDTEFPGAKKVLQSLAKVHCLSDDCRDGESQRRKMKQRTLEMWWLALSWCTWTKLIRPVGSLSGEKHCVTIPRGCHPHQPSSNHSWWWKQSHLPSTSEKKKKAAPDFCRHFLCRERGEIPEKSCNWPERGLTS